MNAVAATTATARRPLFTVVIPVLNDARWLPGAVASVLAQTEARWELIVGDNASDDNLTGVLECFVDSRLVLRRWRRRVGLHENFNRCCSLGSGRWVLPLGADDRLHADCLAVLGQQIESIASYESRLAMVVAACQRVTVDGKPAEAGYFGTQPMLALRSGVYTPEEWLRCATRPGEPVWNIGSLAVSRLVLEHSGGLFRSDVGLCADNELVLRAGAYGHVLYIDRPLLDYTVRPDSDVSARFERGLAERDGQTAHGRALLTGLAAHERRRRVSGRDRQAVHAAVARAYLLRAGAHRLRPGGQGRVGAAADVLRAWRRSPGTLLTADAVLRSLAAVAAPLKVLNWRRDLAARHTREEQA
ncbi:MAG: glycosyltransferase family 2 protein [Chloroflexota bacterium]